jgi:hypothetical protein
MKQLIIEVVTACNGCKLTELPVLMAEVSQDMGENLLDLVDELIASGDLVAVIYTLPDMPYREKTFLLPKGTHIANMRK